MKITVKNLGILKQAEFEVGDLTIICGANNTGKTYATYALYGFLTFWNEAFSYNYINEDDLNKLMTQGKLSIEINAIKKISQTIIDDACNEYSKNLPMVFGSGKKSFSDTSFNILLETVDFDIIDQKILTKSPDGRVLCEMIKARNETKLTIGITASSAEINVLNKNWFLYQINRNIQYILYGNNFPAPFIASIERTGAAMFQKELDISRNRLLEQLSNRNKDIDFIDLFNDAINDGRYALPVRRDVDFIRDLETVTKNESTIVNRKPDILSDFALLAGGEYKVTREGVYYIFNKGKTKLTMGESASSVRSLLNLGMYIQHMARPGDFLMIDEPELNLHPKNQRLMARLLAKLVNANVKVFITTHSDYILKEFNTLIMLKNANTFKNHIMDKYKYNENELLDIDKIRAYIAKKDLTKIDGKTQRQRHNTFVKAPIDMQGIEISEFDETINEMNEIQEQLQMNEDF